MDDALLVRRGESLGDLDGAIDRLAWSEAAAQTPGDDEPGWTEVPARQVLTAVPSEVAVRPLSSLTEGIAIR